MAVERMEMLNIIGHLEDMNFISKELVLLGCIHPVNALHEIDSNNFTISTTLKNMDALVDVCFVKPYRRNQEDARIAEQIETLLEAFELDREDIPVDPDRHSDLAGIAKDIEGVYQKVEKCRKDMESLNGQLSRNQELREHFGYLADLDIPWQELMGMEYFDFRVGTFPKENIAKLRTNYGNIPAIAYPVQSLKDHEVVVTVVPKSLTVELERIYSSLAYQSLHIPHEYQGTPGEIIRSLEEEAQDMEKELEECRTSIQKAKEEYGQLVQQACSELIIYEKMQEINNETACSNDFFYMAGWVPVKEKERLEGKLKPVMKRTLLFYKDPDQVDKAATPPTQLKNSPLLRPFEALVSMYGTPSYHELDPTSFVGLSYMLLFGVMFGDVGQGLLFFLTGCFLSKWKSRPNLGGVFTRLGISSMLFGVLYGSVFGFENWIPALLIRPMENINTMLIATIGLGVVLLSVAFVYSLLNAIRRRDVEEGLLGKNGVAGLLFFWTLLIFVLLYLQKGKLPLPLPAILLILGVLLILMVGKEPVANWLQKKRPLYREPVSDYYIEGGFGIVETLLSMLSNTISFVRVGAFALNHVGLFLAFRTMSEMMKNAAGKTLILIVGNLVIIGLEGLVVFIQGLRLEYYELFSKFYDGSGIPYHPVALKLVRRRKRIGAREAVQ